MQPCELIPLHNTRHQTFHTIQISTPSQTSPSYLETQTPSRTRQPPLFRLEGHSPAPLDRFYPGTQRWEVSFTTVQPRRKQPRRNASLGGIRPSRSYVKEKGGRRERDASNPYSCTRMRGGTERGSERGPDSSALWQGLSLPPTPNGFWFEKKPVEGC